MPTTEEVLELALKRIESLEAQIVAQRGEGRSQAAPFPAAPNPRALKMDLKDHEEMLMEHHSRLETHHKRINDLERKGK